MAKNKARVKIDAHEARLAAQREVYAQLDKIQADMSRQMTRDYMACLLLVLHDEYGFGNKRPRGGYGGGVEHGFIVVQGYS